MSSKSTLSEKTHHFNGKCLLAEHIEYEVFCPERKKRFLRGGSWLLFGDVVQVMEILEWYRVLVSQVEG